MSAATQLVVEPAVTETLTTPEDLLRIEESWRALNERARTGNMFLGPDWLIPWWSAFGAGRELRVVIVREGQRVVGLLPLFAERQGALRRLAFLGDGATGCDELDVLAEPGRELEIFDAVFKEVLRHEWDLLDLDGLWRDSATAVRLAQLFPNLRETGGVLRDSRLRYVCPHIPLDGTWEQYLEKLPRRENLRRREKWLARQPGFSIGCARTPGEAAPATEDFLRLHHARWSVEGGSDGLGDARHDAFHREATARLSNRGTLRMYTLFVARRPVASVYGVVFGGRFNYYQSGYDPLWAGKSPGLVLLARTVQDAFADGLNDFDFLRGNEGYKGEWARAERWTVQLRLWRGARGRALRAGQNARLFARETFKAALPPQLREGVKVARRVLRKGSPLEAAKRLLRDG